METVLITGGLARDLVVLGAPLKPRAIRRRSREATSRLRAGSTAARGSNSANSLTVPMRRALGRRFDIRGAETMGQGRNASHPPHRL